MLKLKDSCIPFGQCPSDTFTYAPISSGPKRKRRIRLLLQLWHHRFLANHKSMMSLKEWETNIDRNQVNIYIDQYISTNHANNEINKYLYILQSWNPIRGRVIKNPGKERGEDKRLNDAGVTNEWFFKLGPLSGPSFWAQLINNQIRQKIQVTLDSILISRRTYKSFHDTT